MKAVQEDDRERIKSVQLLTPYQASEGLSLLPQSMPIDLCLSEPHVRDSLSPEWITLGKTHSVRLIVPVLPGFSLIMKAALRAGLRVMLEIDQPNKELVDELIDGFIFFTLEPDVKEPVDPFFSLFRSFFAKKAQSLWQIQETPTLVSLRYRRRRRNTRLTIGRRRWS